MADLQRQDEPLSNAPKWKPRSDVTTRHFRVDSLTQKCLVRLTRHSVANESPPSLIYRFLSWEIQQGTVEGP